MLLMFFRAHSCNSVLLSDERCLGRSEPDLEGEDGAAGGGHDGLGAVSGRAAGRFPTDFVFLHTLCKRCCLCTSSPVSLFPFQSMFDYLDNAVIKLCDMSTVGTEQGTVKQQIEELKVKNKLPLQAVLQETNVFINCIRPYFQCLIPCAHLCVQN